MLPHRMPIQVLLIISTDIQIVNQTGQLMKTLLVIVLQPHLLGQKEMKMLKSERVTMQEIVQKQQVIELRLI